MPLPVSSSEEEEEAAEPARSRCKSGALRRLWESRKEVAIDFAQAVVALGVIWVVLKYDLFAPPR